MKANIERQAKHINLGHKTMKDIFFEYNSLILLAVLIVVSAILSPAFFTKQNVFNVLRQQSPYMLVALGVMVCLSTGNIDLSTASTVGVGSLVSAIALTKWGFHTIGGLFATILVTILTGMAIGAFNGFFVAYRRMPSFVVTLATMTAGQGLAFLLTNGANIRLDYKNNLASSKLVGFGQAVDSFIGVPYPVYLTLVVVIIFYLIMKYTAFGRLLIATGSNEMAVRLSGINVNKYKFLAFVISGGMAALAGIIVTARASIATPQTTSGDYGLSAIAGAIIGGSRLEGGSGTVTFTMVGMLIMALITNIMNLLSIAAYPQLILKGLIILVAILLRSAVEK